MLPPQIRLLNLPPPAPLPPFGCGSVYDREVVEDFVFDGDDEATYADHAVVGYPNGVVYTRACGDGVVVAYARAFDT